MVISLNNFILHFKSNELLLLTTDINSKTPAYLTQTDFFTSDSYLVYKKNQMTILKYYLFINLLTIIIKLPFLTIK